MNPGGLRSGLLTRIFENLETVFIVEERQHAFYIKDTGHRKFAERFRDFGEVMGYELKARMDASEIDFLNRFAHWFGIVKEDGCIPERLSSCIQEEAPT